MSFCVHCGRESNQKFCPYCGKARSSSGKISAVAIAFGLVGFFVAVAAVAGPRLKGRGGPSPSSSPTVAAVVATPVTSTPAPSAGAIRLLNSTGRLLEICGGKEKPDDNWKELPMGEETSISLGQPGQRVFMRYPGERFHYGTQLDSSRLWAITDQKMRLNEGGSFPVPGILDVSTGNVKDGTVGGF